MQNCILPVKPECPVWYRICTVYRTGATRCNSSILEILNLMKGMLYERY
ncbi:MAG: hypothetical protein K2K35_11160 [Lachnospiraceae bacterium]|nr:hypothetical protein [Lachnospiraceae bacterium]